MSVEPGRAIAPDAPDYLPFMASGAPLRVGVRTLAPGTWLEVDSGREAELALKRRLLAERHSDVVGYLPGVESAAREVLDAIVADLAEHHDVHVTPDSSLHPIDAAGRLVQEDLCLHSVQDGELVLSAASLCFPAGWRLRDKLGRPVRDIHTPVPGYAETLGAPVDRLLARLRGGPGVWRLNWAVSDDPLLHRRPGLSQPEIAVAEVGERLWLRVERQTLRHFSGHDSVLFTIRTYQRPFADLAGRPDVCRALAVAIRDLPPALRRYKNLELHGDVAVEWLDARAES